MKWIIVGRTGQVGRALSNLLPQAALALDRSQVDLSKPNTVIDALSPYIDKVQPLGIFLAAAHTAVDLAESDSDAAFAINAESPRQIAKLCKARGLVLVSYSTDYVFSGQDSAPRKETDDVQPLGVYGKSKLEGELAIASEADRWLCFRTSWVYDDVGKNFLRTMLRLGAERETLKVVNDQTGTPNDAAFVARVSLMATLNEITEPKFRSRIFHLSRAGSTTWFDFAQAIFERARAAQIPLRVQNIVPIPTTEFPTPAKRPKFSVLDTSLLRTSYADLRIHTALAEPWTTGLDQCFQLLRSTLKPM